MVETLSEEGRSFWWHRIRIAVYQLCFSNKGTASRRGTKNLKRRPIWQSGLLVFVGISLYAIGNEYNAWKLILEQECLETTHETSSSRHCLSRTWERWYTHATLTEIQARKLNLHKQATCLQITRLGHWINKDGGWDICTDNFPPSSHEICVVYSFGINPDASFDQDLVRRWPHCTVYAFDPSIGRATGDDFLGPNIQFFNIGLSGQNMERDAHGWKLMTLPAIMDMLHHEKVHLLKMDIESSEWPTWESWMTSTNNTTAVTRTKSNLGTIHQRIDQLIGEVHFRTTDGRPENQRRVAVLGKLSDHWHVFQRRLNFRWTRLTNIYYDGDQYVRTYPCIELGWLPSGG